MQETINKQRELVAGAFEAYIAQPVAGRYVELMQALTPVALHCNRGLFLATLEEGKASYEWSLWPRLALFFGTWAFRRFAVPVDSPQYNDYLMAKWRFTRDASFVEAMYHRAAHCSGLRPEVIASCQWMVASVCEQDEVFAAAVRSVTESVLPHYLRVSTPE